VEPSPAGALAGLGAWGPGRRAARLQHGGRHLVVALEQRHVLAVLLWGGGCWGWGQNPKGRVRGARGTKGEGAWAGRRSRERAHDRRVHAHAGGLSLASSCLRVVFVTYASACACMLRAPDARTQPLVPLTRVHRGPPAPPAPHPEGHAGFAGGLAQPPAVPARTAMRGKSWEGRVGHMAKRPKCGSRGETPAFFSSRAPGLVRVDKSDRGARPSTHLTQLRVDTARLRPTAAWSRASEP
jgi:hypothetical protein